MDRQQIRTIGGYALALLLCVAVVVLANVWFSKPTAEQQLAALHKSKSEILGVFQGRAQIATTEVQLRRIGVYDSDTEFSSLDPSKWKLGKRTCIVPVDMTIKYGIDLRKMKESDIQIDSAGTVKIRLPKPEIIEHNFDLRTNRDDIIAISTLTRAEVGEQTVQKVKMKVVEEVLADTTLFDKLAVEIEHNMQTVFRSMLRGMGLEPQFIE